MVAGCVSHRGEALAEGFLEELGLLLDRRGKICKGRVGVGEVSAEGSREPGDKVLACLGDLSVSQGREEGSGQG